MTSVESDIAFCFSNGLGRNVAEYARGLADATGGLPRRPPVDPDGVLPFDPDTALDYFLGYHVGST